MSAEMAKRSASDTGSISASSFGPNGLDGYCLFPNTAPRARAVYIPVYHACIFIRSRSYSSFFLYAFLNGFSLLGVRFSKESYETPHNKAFGRITLSINSP